MTRLGAINCNLETWHKDIIDFVDLKKNGGEEKRRAKELFTSVSCSDMFMKRVENNEEYTLFDPYDVPELTELYGKAFEEQYEYYERLFEEDPEFFTNEPIKINAKKVWKKIQSMAWDTGMPFVYFKDNANNDLKPNYDEVGLIRSGNLCVTGDTNILTKEYGNIEIGRLVNFGITEATCWNGEEWSLTPIFKTSDSQHVLKVELSNGETIEATDYHKWYVITDYKGNYKEVRTHELTPGDKLIKYNRTIVDHGNDILMHAYDNGLFSADGTNLSYTNDIISLYNDKIDLLQRLTGYDAVSKKIIVNENNNELIRVYYRNCTLFPKFEVPGSNFRISDRLDWLAGVLDGDGYLTNNNGSESIQLASINKKFLLNIKSLLNEIGIDSKVTNGCDERLQEMPLNDGYGSTKEYFCRKTYRLLIPGSEIQNLLSLGLKCSRLKLTNRKYNRSATSYTKVISVIDENKYVPVYCGTEPKRNMLVFNNTLTGNCMEYLSPIKDKEVTLCNLGSINLARVPKERLREVVFTATRMLDNVIDVTEYRIPNSEKTQKERRSIGLGIAGEAEAIANLKIMYGSEEHLEWIDEIYSIFKEASDDASRELAKERGTCKYSDEFRNYHRRCIAPTSSIGLILGTTTSHEPAFGKVWIEENILGDFKMTAPNINLDNYEYYISAYDVDQLKYVETTAKRQKYIDMGISHNAYFVPEETKGKDVYDMYISAWKKGLKTVYYLRSKSRKTEDEEFETVENKVVCFGCA